MAATSRRILLDEDWQEIDTDAFSVLSLSTEVDDDETSGTRPDASSRSQIHEDDDDDSDDDVRSQTLSAGQSPSAFGIATTESELSLRPRSSDAVSYDSPTLVDIATAPSQGPRDTPNQTWAPTYNGNLMDASPSEDHDEDLASGSTQVHDARINPSFLHDFITSAMKLIGGILAYDCSKSLHSLDGFKDLVKQCNNLQIELSALAPIVLAYARHWQPDRNSGGRSIPLDPGLHDWLSRLRLALLAVEQRIHQFMDRKTDALAVDIESHTKVLADLWTQMDAFLPIIEADFDEFHTAEMTFQSLVDDDDEVYSPSPAATSHSYSSPSSTAVQTVPTSRRGRAERPAQPRPSDAVFRLRRELYDLKDKITDCTDELQALLQKLGPVLKPSFPFNLGLEGPRPISNTGGATATADAITEIKKLYDSNRVVLERILSNNPSDWLDYSITGGLTYAEFVRINPDTITSMKTELTDAVGDLFLERCRAESARYMNDPDRLLEDADDGVMRMTIVAPKLDSLRTIGNVIASLFKRNEDAV